MTFLKPIRIFGIKKMNKSYIIKKKNNNNKVWVRDRGKSFHNL